MGNGVLLTVAYDGTAYRGVAPQRNASTVAEVLLDAVHTMDPSVRSLRIASRTDAGVHARGQLISFDTEKQISSHGWSMGLTTKLPDDVSIRRCCLVPELFDPRKVVVGKWYRYTLLRDHLRDPFVHRFSWKIRNDFNDERATNAARRIIGEHDFAAFRSSADGRENTSRRLFDVSVSRSPLDSRLIFIDVRGNAFLHNMVRIIAGTLYDIARGRLEPCVIDEAFETGNRAVLGQTAPASGLCLQQIILSTSAKSDNCWPSRLPTVMMDPWPKWQQLADAGR